MTTDPRIASLRKRISMFYFAAGANIVMALLVLAAGGGTVGLAAMAVFLVFAVVQFYMARNMQKRWQALLQQQAPQKPENTN